ncbi:MAG TPA: hypothetical protein VF627_00480 [Abditibacterium sp.]|jgi:hypothetical protein
MKFTSLLLGISLLVSPAAAKPRLQLVKMTLIYEMKKSLHSLPASPTSVHSDSAFTLMARDSFIIDSASREVFRRLALQPRIWKGNFKVTGKMEITDNDGRSTSVVRGGRALTKAEMPTISLQPATMGKGNELSFGFDFPVALEVQTTVTSNGATQSSKLALPGVVPLCLDSSNDKIVFRHTIDANPPLTRRPTDEGGARVFDGFKELQKRGEFWLSKPVFWTLKQEAPNLYTLRESRDFPYKPSKTETEKWTQSLTLRLEISPAPYK